jgi:phenylacetate-CoA ligase
VLSEGSGYSISDTDLQLVEVDYEEQGLGLILMVCHRIRLSEDTIIDRLKSSSLIRELISDALYFHVFITDKRTFLKSESTHKIKPFLRTKIRPIEEYSSCLTIK